MAKRFTGFGVTPLVGTAALMIVANTEAAACSGPGAAAAIRQAQVIGLSLAGTALFTVSVASIFLTRRRQVIAPLVLGGLAVTHPGFWESATHGDCGYSLIVDSLLMTVVMGVSLTAALLWRRRVEDTANKLRGTISGGLAGAVVGALFVFVTLSASVGSGETLWLSGWSFVSIVTVGALSGALVVLAARSSVVSLPCPRPIVDDVRAPVGTDFSGAVADSAV